MTRTGTIIPCVLILVLATTMVVPFALGDAGGPLEIPSRDGTLPAGKEPEMHQEESGPADSSPGSTVEGTGNTTATLEKEDLSGNYVFVQLTINGTGSLTPEWRYVQQAGESGGGVTAFQRVTVKNAATMNLIGHGVNSRKEVAFGGVYTEPNTTEPGSVDYTLTVSAQKKKVAATNKVDRGSGSFNLLARSYHLLGSGQAGPGISTFPPLQFGITDTQGHEDSGGMTYDRYAGSYTSVETGELSGYMAFANSTDGSALSSQAYRSRKALFLSSNTLSEQWFENDIASRIPAYTGLMVTDGAGIAFSSSASGGKNISAAQVQFTVGSAERISRNRIAGGGVRGVDPVLISDSLDVMASPDGKTVSSKGSGTTDTTARPGEARTDEKVSLTGSTILRSTGEDISSGLEVTSKDIRIREGFAIGNLTSSQRSSLDGWSSATAVMNVRQPSALVKGSWTMKTDMGREIARRIEAVSGALNARSDSMTTGGSKTFTENAVASPGRVDAT